MRKYAVPFLAALALGGCVGAPTGIIDAAFVGKYSLETINDFAIPYAVANDPGYTLIVTSDTISLEANGGFADVSHYNRTKEGVVDSPTTNTTGTWRANGNAIKIVTADGYTYQAVFSASKLSLTGGGIISVYARN